MTSIGDPRTAEIEEAYRASSGIWSRWQRTTSTHAALQMVRALLTGPAAPVVVKLEFEDGGAIRFRREGESL